MNGICYNKNDTTIKYVFSNKIFTSSNNEFKVLVKDKKGLVSERKLLVKNENDVLYGKNISPNIEVLECNNSILKIQSKNGGKIKSIKIQDLNNQGKDVDILNNVEPNSITSVNLNKYTKIDGEFKIRVIEFDTYLKTILDISTKEKITIVPINNFKLTLEKSKVDWTGKAITQKIKVVDTNNHELRLNIDYTVRYSNNINPGKATVTVNGKGNYIGTIKNGFSIVKDKVYFLNATYKNYEKENSVPTGDAIIIESAGKFAMVDTGCSVTSKRLGAFIKKLNIKQFEFVLITHGHADHFGGFKSIYLNGTTVKKLYIKDYKKWNEYKYESVQKATKRIYNLEEYAKEHGTNVIRLTEKDEATEKIKLGNFVFKLYNLKIFEATENSNSILILLKNNGKNIYLAGDFGYDESATDLEIKNHIHQKVTKDYVRKMIKNIWEDANGNIHIYKAAHHGQSGEVSENVGNHFKNMFTGLKQPQNTIITNKERSIVNNLKEWLNNSKFYYVMNNDYTRKYSYSKYKS